MALTDNLNFGNPERPEIMGQLVGCIQGIAAACKALEFPVVSGNVSLYNETNGRAILPTPTIGGVGLIDDFAKSASIAFKAADETDRAARRNQGLDRPVALSARDLRARGGGAAAGRPDGGAARGDFVRGLIDESFVTAVHDISDGGLLVAVAEMALASGIGAKLYGPPAFLTEHGFWFGEDQARYVVTIKPERLDDLAARARTAGVPLRRIGIDPWQRHLLPGERPILLDTLRERHEGWLPAYMAAAANLRILHDADGRNEIEQLIRAGIPDAQVTIRDLAGDGDHYAATVIAASFRASRGCSSTSWSIRPSRAKWAANCTLWRCRPARQRAEFPQNSPNRRGLGCTTGLRYICE